MELTDSQVQRSDSNYCEWPDPDPIADPFFSWGDSDSTTFIANVNKAYEEKARTVNTVAAFNAIPSKAEVVAKAR